VLLCHFLKYLRTTPTKISLYRRTKSLRLSAVRLSAHRFVRQMPKIIWASAPRICYALKANFFKTKSCALRRTSIICALRPRKFPFTGAERFLRGYAQKWWYLVRKFFEKSKKRGFSLKKKLKKGPKFFCYLGIWRTNFLSLFLFGHLAHEYLRIPARNEIPLNYLRRTYGQE